MSRFATPGLAKLIASITLSRPQYDLVRAVESNDVHTIGFGGAKKGGKSKICRHIMMRRRMEYPGTSGLITRRAYADVIANHYHELKADCDKYLGKKRWRWDGQRYYFEFLDYQKDGQTSKLYLGYAEDEKDAERYQGLGLMDIFHEEAAQQIWKVLVKINGELMPQPMYPGVTPKLIYSWNPIGVGKYDIKLNVKAPALRGEPGYVFIFSNYLDNPVLDHEAFAELIQREYKDEPWMIAALLDGDDSTDPDRFYVFDEAEGGRNVRVLKVPYWASHVCGVDYGYYPSAWGVIYAARWQDRTPLRNVSQPHMVVDPDTKVARAMGNKVIYPEHWHVYGEIQQWRMEPNEQAQMAREYEGQIGFPPPPYSLRWGDPAIMQHTPTHRQDVNRTIKSMWDAEGWYVTPARKCSKLAGQTVMRRLLKSGVMTIDPECRGLITQLANAKYEELPGGRFGSGTDPRLPDDMEDAARYPSVETWGLDYAQPDTGPYDSLAEVA